MNEVLANQLRPKSIKQVFGQNHLLSSQGVLTRMVAARQPFSLIFYGKPGIGKTTLSLALANDLNIPYQVFHAANDKKEKLVEILQVARLSHRYILLLEEIHRLNRDKQDILLSALEQGKIIMFASNPENPIITVNPAIRSRCQVYELHPLDAGEATQALAQAAAALNLKNLTPDVLRLIALRTQGDLRAALNVVDIVMKLYPRDEITPGLLNGIMSASYVTNSHYDDEMHNLKSALHKSIRGSDVDASLHYLARLIVGNDLVSISRRLIMVAYEDVGLANPNLCMRTYVGVQAAKEVGFPEAATILGDLVIELALSPKSNSGVTAINLAMADAAGGRAYEIPKHLWDNNYASSKKLGVKGYKYPHSYENAWVEQQYLPAELLDRQYYKAPKHSAYEQKLSAWLKDLRRYKED